MPEATLGSLNGCPPQHHALQFTCHHPQRPLLGDRRDVPAYSIPFAARLVSVPEPTLRSWVRGRQYRTVAGEQRALRVIKPASRDELSFTNLVEAYILSAMRKDYRLQLKKVRRAVQFVEGELLVERPLARQEFRTDGVHLFVEHLGKLLNVSEEGQCAIREAFEDRMERVEYNKGSAVRLFPLSRGTEPQPKLIVVDPERAFGEPVLDGTGIPISSILNRFKGGDSCRVLAKDYGVRVEAIKEAIRAA